MAGGLDLGIGGIGVGDLDVFANRGLENKRILGNNPKAFANLGPFALADVLATEMDTALVGIIKPQHELRDGALARTRGAHQRHRLAVGNREADIGENGFFLVGEGDSAELQITCGRNRLSIFLRVRGGGGFCQNLRNALQRSLGRSPHGESQGDNGERRGELLESKHEHGDFADGDFSRTKSPRTRHDHEREAGIGDRLLLHPSKMGAHIALVAFAGNHLDLIAKLTFHRSFHGMKFDSTRAAQDVSNGSCHSRFVFLIVEVEFATNPPGAIHHQNLRAHSERHHGREGPVHPYQDTDSRANRGERPSKSPRAVLVKLDHILKGGSKQVAE